MTPEPTPTETTEKKPRDPRALNAYRHGLTGQVVILTTSDEEAYKIHVDGLTQAFAPVGNAEAEFVQAICDDRWRLKRAVCMENSIFAMGHISPKTYTSQHPEVEAALHHGEVWLTHCKELDRLTLYERRIHRNMERNMDVLEKLQQKRQADVERAVEEAALAAKLAAIKGQPWDIERDYPRELLPPNFVFSNAQIARIVAHKAAVAEAKMSFLASPKSARRAA